MATRYRKRYHLLPGLRVTFSGPLRPSSITLGKPGLFSYTIGKGGARGATVDLPGGFSHSSYRSRPSSTRNAASEAPEEATVLDENTPAPALFLSRAERLWKKGYNAYERGQRDRAERYWRQAVSHDPHLADAWLGLHALYPCNPDIITHLGQEADSIGYCQQRFSRQLHSVYWPAAFAEEWLVVADDARRALARELGLREHYDQAFTLLDRCRPCAETSAVRARLYLHQGQMQQCLRETQSIDAEGPLAADVLLISGLALRGLGLFSAASDSLRQAAKLADDADACRCARYHLALSLEDDGQSRRARQELESIYREDMTYADVAERLGLTEQDQRSDDPFSDIVASLTSGQVADDPRLPDNQ